MAGYKVQALHKFGRDRREIGPNSGGRITVWVEVEMTRTPLREALQRGWRNHHTFEIDTRHLGHISNVTWNGRKVSFALTAHCSHQLARAQTLTPNVRGALDIRLRVMLNALMDELRQRWLSAGLKAGDADRTELRVSP